MYFGYVNFLNLGVPFSVSHPGPQPCLGCAVPRSKFSLASWLQRPVPGFVLSIVFLSPNLCPRLVRPGLCSSIRLHISASALGQASDSVSVPGPFSIFGPGAKAHRVFSICFSVPIAVPALVFVCHQTSISARDFPPRQPIFVRFLMRASRARQPVSFSRLRACFPLVLWSAPGSSVLGS
jgi:hypothetical protein